MNTEDAVDDMAMAHLRLSQSLRSLSLGRDGYAATEAALVALSEAIAKRVSSPTGSAR